MGRGNQPGLVRALHGVVLAFCFGFYANAALSQPVKPARVVSANLCADQLVMALADPAQIVSLGPFARDATLSFMHGQAAPYPSNRGSAEEMIGLRADLVLLGSFDSRYARAVLERQDIAVMLVDPWTTLEQGRQQIRAVAARLGQAERGEAMIGRIDAGTARLRAFAALRGRATSALVLHRRGYALQSSVASELAAFAGVANAAPGLGLIADGLLPLEKIVADPPGFLIVTHDNPADADQGEALLAHPALVRLFPPDKRLVVPDRLAICAGPSTPALIDALVSEIARKVR